MSIDRIDPFKEGRAAAAARRRRSIAIALMLLAFVALVFVTTAVRLTQNRAEPAQPAGAEIAPAPESGAGRR